MASDYQCDKLEVTEMRMKLAPIYVPKHGED